MEDNVNFKAECVCGSTHFMQEDGKTFCMECQTELEAAKEIVYETVDYVPEIGDLTQRSRVLTTTVKKQAVKAKELPTSWECFNQILCNLVDEIEEIEDSLFDAIKRDFKLTVLQLWAAYLRYHGKAFFSKESADYPQFNSNYNILDAEIIYKIKRPQKIYVKRKRQAVSNARARKRNIRTIQRKANQLELSKQKPSVPTETQKSSIPFQFTPQAKKRLKTLMSDEHLKEHENNPMLKCHRYRYRDTNRKSEEITRTKLYVLIFMALNHVESGIQLGDFIRFLREDHVSLQITTSVSNDARYNLDFNTRIQKGMTNVPYHYSLREIASDLAKEIGFKFKPVDLSVLCRRYLEELCLPPEIGNLIDVILDACPPTMGEGSNHKNYEGRAMAYIVFILKLLFGLDDRREYLISSSAREINKKISELASNNESSAQQKQLFVWSDWVEYIEMRDIILAQLHCPTAMKSYAHSDGMTAMYLEHLTKTDEKNADVKSTFKPNAKLMQRVRDLFKVKYNIDPKLNEKLHFYPSLTPKRSYMDEVRFSGQFDIFVPTFMDVLHDDRDIEPFLNPSKLKTFFRQHQVNVAVNKLKCDANIDVDNSKRNMDELENADKKFGKYCLFDFNITTQEWLEELNDRKIIDENRIPQEEAKKLVEERLKEISDHSRIGKEKRKSVRQNDDMKAMEMSNDSSQNFSGATIFDCISSDEDEENDDQSKETVDFSISNSDYWLLFNSFYANKHEFADFQRKLPKTFQWLLKQAADVIENRETDVYVELMVIEYYFTKNMEPFSEKFGNLLNRFKTICRKHVCNNY